MKKFYLIALAAGIITAEMVCFSGYGQTVKNKIVEIKSSHNVAGKEIPLTTDIFFPRKMLMISANTVAVTESKDEYALRIVKVTADSVYLTSKAGRTGQGPGDVLNGINDLQRDNYNSVEGVWLSDVQSMKFHRYLPESNSLEYKPVEVKKLPADVFPCSRSQVLKNSGILGMSSAINNNIFIYSSENQTLQGYDFYPVNPNPYDKFVSKNVYSARMNLKPDKSQFVLAYQWFKALCIVSLDNLSNPLYITFKDSDFPKFNATDQNANVAIFRKLPLQYIGMYVTDKHIYAMYAGKTGNKMENYSTEALKDAVSIHVFNWDGSFHCAFNLDRIINCFCVDEQEGVIYGLDPVKEENSAFYRFDIRGF
jgi:hypothetical protein